MAKDGTSVAAPRLRFPEFRAETGWTTVPLEVIAERISTKNPDGTVTRVLTNSAVYGVLDQRDYFDRDIATAGKHPVEERVGEDRALHQDACVTERVDGRRRGEIDHRKDRHCGRRSILLLGNLKDLGEHQILRRPATGIQRSRPNQCNRSRFLSV